MDEERCDLRIYSMDEVKNFLGKCIEILLLIPMNKNAFLVDEDNYLPIPIEMFNPKELIITGRLESVRTDGACNVNSVPFSIQNIRRIRVLVV